MISTIGKAGGRHKTTLVRVDDEFAEFLKQLTEEVQADSGMEVTRVQVSKALARVFPGNPANRKVFKRGGSKV